MLDLTTDRGVVAETPQPVERGAEQVACGRRPEEQGYRDSGIVGRRLGASRPQPDLGPQWFVVACWPKAERWAASNLSRTGYEIYLPLHTVRIRDNGIRSLWHQVERPLFSGYLFTRFDALRDPWTPICRTEGVQKLLMSGPRPGIVADSLIAALRATETARRSFPVVGPVFAPGAAVRVCEGALEGHEAVVITTHHDRAHIAVMLFGAVRNVNVSLTALSVRE